MKRILITGACGFVGHHVVEHVLKNTDWEIVTLDRLSKTTEYGFDRLRDIEAFDNERVTRYTADLTKPIGEGLQKEIGDINYVINLASGSHVDNSIESPVEFVNNNVNIALRMFEYARTLVDKGCLEKFVQFSTDEVYGTAPEGTDYKEGDRHNPGNPYSASKSAQESIAYAYSNTYGIPTVITNTMNVLGERQHPEKFLPLVMNKVLNGEKVSIHGNKECTKAGSRFYIHARNVADGVLYVLTQTDELLDNIDAAKGKFNIVGEKELDNLELAQLITKCIQNVPGYEDKELDYEIVDFHSSRPGHDLRYALDGSKMKSLGWEPPHSIEESIQNIVSWTLNGNEIWLK